MPAADQLARLLGAASLQDAKLWLLALFLSMIRWQAMLAIIPLFNRSVVPMLIQGAFAAALSTMQAPAVYQGLTQQAPASGALAMLVLQEGLIGLVMGYAVAVLFWAVEGLGFIIDNQRGASIASTLNPLTGNDTSPLGALFNQAFIVYFMMGGGIFILLKILYGSYRIWPMFGHTLIMEPTGTAVFGQLFQQIITLALLLATPVIVAMLLGEIGLALVSRFAPQLQVFFLAMPVKSGIAFLVLVVYLPTLFEYIRGEVTRLPGVLDLLSGAMR